MAPFRYPACMRSATLQHHRTRIARVERHLSEHLDEPVDLAALAKLASLSPRQFERVFTRTLGETPHAHARRLKLERAAARLRATRSTILTIAIDAGFESHEAFTRAVRERFGSTPAAYRRVRHATLQPRIRAQVWQLAGAALRQHVER